MRERGRERKKTRNEINLRTNLFPGRTQVLPAGFFKKFNPTTFEGIKCTIGNFFLFKIEIVTFKMINIYPYIALLFLF